MTTKEFSDQFDTLINSYANIPEFGEMASKMDLTVDEYEKSVFLTQAQDIILKRYFYAHENAEGQGFDTSERRQTDFSSLIKSELISMDNTQTGSFDKRGILYTLPSTGSETKVLYILNERLIVETATSRKEYVVKPINYREYDRVMSKPYTQPLKKQAWRLFQNIATGFDIHTEIIPVEGSVPPVGQIPEGMTVKYKLRYVRRPNPIVLVNLPDDLEINGVNTEQTCELNPILHVDILQEAVRLALASKGVNIKSNEQ